MYKIKAPNEEYDRKIGGVQFVSGEAQTDNEWLASWFSGRPGFTVETVTAEEETEPTEDKPRGKRRNDKGNCGRKACCRTCRRKRLSSPAIWYSSRSATTAI